MRMPKLVTSLIAVLFSSVVMAQDIPVSLSAKIIYDFVDVESADFDGSLSLEGAITIPANEHISFEAAITGLNDSQSDRLEDNTGSYQLTLNSIDLLAGVQLQFFQSKQWRGYARGGVLYYNMDVELEEAFYDLKPAGTVSESDNGFGYYLGVGTTMQTSAGWALVCEATYRARLDVFDDSSKPFDVNSFGVSFGIQHQL
jgi:hypothetical protein